MSQLSTRSSAFSSSRWTRSRISLTPSSTPSTPLCGRCCRCSSAHRTAPTASRYWACACRDENQRLPTRWSPRLATRTKLTSALHTRLTWLHCTIPLTLYRTVGMHCFRIICIDVVLEMAALRDKKHGAGSMSGFARRGPLNHSHAYDATIRQLAP